MLCSLLSSVLAVMEAKSYTEVSEHSHDILTACHQISLLVCLHCMIRMHWRWLKYEETLLRNRFQVPCCLICSHPFSWGTSWPSFFYSVLAFYQSQEINPLLDSLRLRWDGSPVCPIPGEKENWLVFFISLSDYEKLRTELGRRSQLLTCENVTKPTGKIHTRSEKYQKAKAMIGHRIDLIHYRRRIPMEEDLQASSWYLGRGLTVGDEDLSLY